MATKFFRLMLLAIIFASPPGFSQSLWKNIPLPSSTREYKFIDFSDSLSGWIFTDDGQYAKTSDGGQSWVRDSIGTPHQIKQIKAFSKTTCWVVYSDDSRINSILSTVDGAHWKSIAIPDTLNKVIGKIEFSSPTTIWLPSYRNGIFVSSDYGQSWVLNHGTWGLGCNIDFADSLNGYLAFWNPGVGGESYGRTFRTKDGGVVWDSIRHDDLTTYRQVKFYSSTYGFIITSWTGMDGFPTYHSLGIFNGTTSSGSTDISLINSFLGGLHLDSGKDLIITSNHRMARTSSDTMSYLLSQGAAGDPVIAFESVPERSNWILCSGNRLYKSVDIPTVVERGPSTNVVSYNLAQNYPNPANPSTTISFTIPSKSFVNLKIYDVLGKEVATLAKEEFSAGTYSRTWNAVSMPSGVYFYRIQAGAFTGSKKLLLIR
jgi:photosystem II stability/assembly factor-like uncharacterized protein